MVDPESDPTVDPNLGHTIPISLVDAWRQYRTFEGLCFDGENQGYRLALGQEEHRRVDVQHELLQLVLNGQYIVPEVVRPILASRDGPAPCILDLGTGTGSWAISMANEFPHAEVVGIDLVLPNPDLDIPPNCRFEVDDVNLSLKHYSNCFDVVHCRLLDSGIHDYPRFMNQIARILRPGGIVLFVKAFHQLFSEFMEPLPLVEEGEPGFAFVQRMFTASYEAIKNRGGSEDASLRYELWLTQNPNFSPTMFQVRDLYVPLGPWPSVLDARSNQICELMRLNFQILIRAFRPLLLGEGYREDTIERWIQETDKELLKLIHRVYTKWRFAWGIRGKDPWFEWVYTL